MSVTLSFHHHHLSKESMDLRPFYYKYFNPKFCININQYLTAFLTLLKLLLRVDGLKYESAVEFSLLLLLPLLSLAPGTSVESILKPVIGHNL